MSCAHATSVRLDRSMKICRPPGEVDDALEVACTREHARERLTFAKGDSILPPPRLCSNVSTLLRLPRLKPSL
jgi:hypothetical protein